MTRYGVRRITENNSRINTIVIGLKVLLAILNQIKENDQKIIAITTALYVLTLLFNNLYFGIVHITGVANLILKFVFIMCCIEKLEGDISTVLKIFERAADILAIEK